MDNYQQKNDHKLIADKNAPNGFVGEMSLCNLFDSFSYLSSFFVNSPLGEKYISTIFS